MGDFSMNSLLSRRRNVIENIEYFHFEDPEVERVIANAIGDGVGTTLSQILASTTVNGTLFRNNTVVETFDEFELFSGGSTALSGFDGCTNLKSIKVPSRFTSFVASGGVTAFNGCSELVDLDVRNIPSSGANNRLGSCGNWTGVLRLKSIYQSRSITPNIYHFKEHIIYEGIYINSVIAIYTGRTPEILRFGGTLNGPLFNSSTSDNWRLKFIDMKNASSRELFPSGAAASNNVYQAKDYYSMHCSYNGIGITVDQIKGRSNTSIGKLTKLYVGNGSSQQYDEDILDLYLANTSWSSYSSKLVTWYSYNGEYRTYSVTDNLTNCTNSNPDNWPHISRGKSYQTSIVPNTGYSINYVTVEMYEAVDDGATPSSPTNITSTVYNSSTGSINIPSVTGNVIITATAS